MPHVVGLARNYPQVQKPDLIIRLQRALGNRAVERILSNAKYSSQLQRIADSSGFPLGGCTIQRQSPPSEVQQAEFEKDRDRFAQNQDEHFAIIGEEIKKHILREAGFDAQTAPADAAGALKIIKLWGLSITDLVKQLPQLGAALSTQIKGSNATTTLEQKADQLTAAMSKRGQETFKAALDTIRSEPFWRNWLDNHVVIFLPDLTGQNRYSGYTQRSDDRWNPGFIIHISKDALEAGETKAVVATLIHELSHTTYEGSVEKAIRPFLRQIASLLADHPDVSALRAKAKDKNEARETHSKRIAQILYEKTAYAEGEIFVHLHQLTSQPPVTTGGVTISADRFILARVAGFVEQLKQIHLPQRMLLGVLDSLARRVQLLYDSRIAPMPQGSRARRLMELSKAQAATILELARSETGTDR